MAAHLFIEGVSQFAIVVEHEPSPLPALYRGIRTEKVEQSGIRFNIQRVSDKMEKVSTVTYFRTAAL